jgi:site-specific DNA-methyltransferase (adenine-specific)
MELPPIPPDLCDRLREDIRLRGILVPILVDNATDEVIDGRLRRRIADELGIREIPTIHVGGLTPGERDDLRVVVNLYRRHLTRAQMRELVAWRIRRNPGESDRCVAERTGASHPTVARVRRGLEAGGTIYQLPTRDGRDGKKYPARKPATFACSAAESRRARALLGRLGDDAPGGTTSLRVLHKLANRKERAALVRDPDAELPAGIQVECCDFRDLAVPDGAVDLIFTDPPWGEAGLGLMPDLAGWAARKLRPDGGLLLLYTGHDTLPEAVCEIGKTLNFVWPIACYNGANVADTRHNIGIRSLWRPMLLFARGQYRAGKVFDDAIVSTDYDKTHHDHQQPLGEALFFIKALTRPKATICDPFLGSATTACACVRLGCGRRFWGSELDPDTYAIARSRVAEEVRSGGTEAASAG